MVNIIKTLIIASLLLGQSIYAADFNSNSKKIMQKLSDGLEASKETFFPHLKNFACYTSGYALKNLDGIVIETGINLTRYFIKTGHLNFEGEVYLSFAFFPKPDGIYVQAYAVPSIGISLQSRSLMESVFGGKTNSSSAQDTVNQSLNDPATTSAISTFIANAKNLFSQPQARIKGASKKLNAFIDSVRLKAGVITGCDADFDKFAGHFWNMGTFGLTASFGVNLANFIGNMTAKRGKHDNGLSYDDGVNLFKKSKLEMKRLINQMGNSKANPNISQADWKKFFKASKNIQLPNLPADESTYKQPDTLYDALVYLAAPENRQGERNFLNNIERKLKEMEKADVFGDNEDGGIMWSLRNQASYDNPKDEIKNKRAMANYLLTLNQEFFFQRLHQNAVKTSKLIIRNDDLISEVGKATNNRHIQRWLREVVETYKDERAALSAMRFALLDFGAHLNQQVDSNLNYNREIDLNHKFGRVNKLPVRNGCNSLTMNLNIFREKESIELKVHQQT